MFRLVFLKKPDVKFEKGPRGFRANALLNVFSKLYTIVLVNLSHEEQEPVVSGAGRLQIADTYRPWRRTYSTDIGNGKRTGGSICSQD